MSCILFIRAFRHNAEKVSYPADSKWLLFAHASNKAIPKLRAGFGTFEADRFPKCKINSRRKPMEIFILGFLMIALVAVFGAAFIWMRISHAKYKAIQNHWKEVALFGGIMKLILWETNEGLVFLKNKQIWDVIENSRGGIRYIFPVRGEELRERIPLTLHLLTWENEQILTRESIQVGMKVALWWRVSNLQAYAFGFDKEVHVEGHVQSGLMKSAEIALQVLTESTLRMIISQLSVAFLVSPKATSYLHVEKRHETGQSLLHSNSDVMASETTANRLHQELALKTQEYGIEIQRVEIQEIFLSTEIQEAIDKVWTASLLPAQTEQEARARQIELQAVAQVLGVEATALNEILRNFQYQSSNPFTLPQLLETLLAKVQIAPNALPPGIEAQRLPANTKIDREV